MVGSSAGKVSALCEEHAASDGKEDGSKSAVHDASGCDKMDHVGTLAKSPADFAGASGFESPFKALHPWLRAFQYLGVFNFSFDAKCSYFVCQPVRLVYSFFLNVMFLLVPVCLNFSWYQMTGLSALDIYRRLAAAFSTTDFVAVIGLFLLFQISSLGLHLANMNLCYNLGELTETVRLFGVVGECHKCVQNPRCSKITAVYISILGGMVVSTFLVGWSLSGMIDLSLGSTDLVLGLSEALATTYLLLPQILCDLLFLRMVDVLDFHAAYLTRHMDTCLSEDDPAKKGKRHNCCLNRANNLLRLFDTIDDTFKKQLLVQFLLLLSSLICAIYLAISVVVGGREGISNTAGYCRFSAGFCLFSLVPAVRLFYMANRVNSAMGNMRRIQHGLYALECATAFANPALHAKTRLAIRKYAEVEGFSASDFFVVNHRLVTSIVGYLFTYIIVLLQFKIAETASSSS